MKIQIMTFCFIWLLLNCSCYQSDRQKLADNTTSEFEDCDTFHHFDEYQMEGVGIPTEESFVSVVKKPDSIKVAYQVQEQILYKTYSLVDDKWFSEKSFDTDRTTWIKDGRFPRLYYQWCVGDTVLQFESIQSIDKSEITSIVYVKTKKSITFINLGKTNLLGQTKEDIFNQTKETAEKYSLYYTDLSKADHVVQLTKMGIPHEVGYLVFKTIYNNNKVSHMADLVKETIEYKGNSMAASTISFGFEDFEEFRYKKPAEPSIDGIYRLKDVDNEPIVKKTNERVQEYVSRVSQTSHGNFSHQTIVAEIIVSQQGKVYKAKINRSVNKQEDEMLLGICYSIPDLTPATRNGRNVPVRIIVSTSF